MCTPISSGPAFKGLSNMIQSNREMAANNYSSNFMAPRGDVNVINPPRINPSNATTNPMGNAMVGMAIAKNNPSAFANGPIKVNTSNQQTGRVIS